jgi:AcrR family transcriptional regulator
MILKMGSVVTADLGDRPVVRRSVERTLAERYSAYAEEVDRLIRAGLAVMQKGGTTNPRVSEIVAEAGLSNQAFYRHFRGKDELLLAISDEGLRLLVGYLEHQMAKEDTGLARVRRWVEGILAQAAQPVAADATRPVVLNRERLTAAFPEECRRSEERIKEPLRRAVVLAAERGEIVGADTERDVEAAFRLALGSMQDWLTSRYLPSQDDVEHLVGFILAGLSRGVVDPQAGADGAIEEPPWNAS